MTEPDDRFVLYRVEDRVAIVTLNRPHRLNALVAPMTEQLLDAYDRADADGAVGAVVLTGAGRGFCGGADFERLRTIEADSVEANHRLRRRDRAMRLTKPMIAAVNGSVGGAGLAHALMADVRFAAVGAKWTTAFARYGLVAELGSSWLLSRLVGPGRAHDLLLSARVFTTEEAYQYGLAEFVCPADEVLEKAVEYARAMSSLPPYSLRQIREQIHADLARGWDESYWDSVARTQASLSGAAFHGRLPEGCFVTPSRGRRPRRPADSLAFRRASGRAAPV